MSQPQLILSSGSPRRRELLAEAGYDFRVVAARDGVEEGGLCSNCGPAELVVDLALLKLDDVVAQLASESGPLLVLAADTVAECDGHILGKPADEDHAAAMMRRLSGRPHRVYTGVALAWIASGVAEHLAAEAVVTTLRMNELSEGWIAEYAASGAWEGKAGGFGYQDGLGFVHVEAGSESNVVGLPMERVAELLAAAGCFPGRGGQP
jgi:septum formation protein